MEDPYARVEDLGNVVELRALVLDRVDRLPREMRLSRDPRSPEHDDHDDDHGDRGHQERDRDADLPDGYICDDHIHSFMYPLQSFVAPPTWKSAAQSIELACPRTVPVPLVSPTLARMPSKSLWIPTTVAKIVLTLLLI